MSWFRRSEHWDDLTKDQKVEFTLAYQRLFDPENPDAMMVLSHMLGELGHFRESTTDEEVILCNYSKRLLRNIGLWRRGRSKQIVLAYLDNARF